MVNCDLMIGIRRRRKVSDKALPQRKQEDFPEVNDCWLFVPY